MSDPGRVAHWSFDNVAGARAFNTRFNALHADLNSASVRPGVVGQALHFDETLGESYAFVSLYDGGVNAVPTFNDNRISIAMWIRPERLQSGGSYVLFGGNGGGTQSFHLRLIDGRLTLLLNGINNGGSIEDQIIQSTALAVPGQWQHLAVTYDGATARVYLNGAQDAQRNITHPISPAYNTLYIGGVSEHSGFPGDIDELWLSNEVLSPAQIAGLADASAASPDTRACGTVAAGPLLGPGGPGGQEAHWSFDNVVAAQARNTRFDALHAVLNSVGIVPGAVGQGVAFDATARQSYAEISVQTGGTSRSLVFPDARISMAMWIRPEQVQPGASYVLLDADSFSLRIVDGKPTFQLNSLNSNGPGTDVMLQSASSVVAAQWQHVAITSDGLTVRFYRNGVLDTQKVVSHGVRAVLNPLYIGGRTAFFGPMTFPGTIDEVKLSNITFSAADIAVLATR